MRKSPKKWTIEEINFLQNNYSQKGSIYCSEKLNLDIQQIRNKIKLLKLSKEQKIDIDQFVNINKKEIAYIFGIIWSDGCIKNKDGHHHRIDLCMLSDDMMNIKDLFFSVGNWKIYKMTATKNLKDKLIFHIGDKKLHEIFEYFDYDKKSSISPFKILNNIPDDLKKYFYRGIIDGDGCFYKNKKNYTNQFILASTFEQDWTYMIDLCEKLNISKYRIDRVKKTLKNNKISKSSSFRICRKKDIILLGEYIYQNYDEMGLKRKYNKYKEICQN